MSIITMMLWHLTITLLKRKKTPLNTTLVCVIQVGFLGAVLGGGIVQGKYRLLYAVLVLIQYCCKVIVVGTDPNADADDPPALWYLSRKLFWLQLFGVVQIHVVVTGNGKVSGYDNFRKEGKSPVFGWLPICRVEDMNNIPSPDLFVVIAPDADFIFDKCGLNPSTIIAWMGNLPLKYGYESVTGQWFTSNLQPSVNDRNGDKLMKEAKKLDCQVICYSSEDCRKPENCFSPDLLDSLSLSEEQQEIIARLILAMFLGRMHPRNKYNQHAGRLIRKGGTNFVMIEGVFKSLKLTLDAIEDAALEIPLEPAVNHYVDELLKALQEKVNKTEGKREENQKAVDILADEMSKDEATRKDLMLLCKRLTKITGKLPLNIDKGGLITSTDENHDTIDLLQENRDVAKRIFEKKINPAYDVATMIGAMEAFKPVIVATIWKVMWGTFCLYSVLAYL
jgi:hypothetical protein